MLGGIALLAALALSGLNHVITRLFEGYPLQAAKDKPILKQLYGWSLKGQERRYDALMAVREDESKDSLVRGLAGWKLDRSFPARRERLLPTGFGNAVRAFEGHSRKRYGLDDVAAFPRVEMFLPASEREPLVDAKIDVNVFMNAAVGTVLIGITLIVDAVVHTPVAPEFSWLYLLPFVVAYVLYVPMIGAAVRWGTEVRSSMDLHRLELYEKLGVRAPTSFADEAVVAGHVNRLLLYGFPPPDDVWRPPELAVPAAPAAPPATAPPASAGPASSPLPPPPPGEAEAPPPKEDVDERPAT